MGTQIVTLAELPEIAAQVRVWATRQYPRTEALLIGLSGELGAGKTTFIQTMAHELGVAETVTSPTFVIQKNYPVDGQPFARLVHVDAYRIEHAEELQVLNFAETLADSENLILLEWPERVADALPADYPRITFTVVDENTRELTFHGFKEDSK